MSSIVQTAVGLAEVMKGGKTVYVHCQPEIIDFTIPVAFTISVHGKTASATFAVNNANFQQVTGLLLETVLVPDVTVIGWNLKNLLSTALHLRKRPLQVSCQVFDLKPLEAYFGERKARPANFAESVGRLKSVLGHKNWPDLKTVYARVHLPLILTVIPEIETYSVLDEQKRLTLYPYYEIEGQQNGRMKCTLEYAHGYLPHVITPEEKERFIPRSRDEFFMYFDYEHMEVSVLQWLSGDEKLGELLAGSQDVYAAIFGAVTGQNNREHGKKLFLPVIYGESPAKLAAEWKVSVETAQLLVNRLKNLLPESFAWIERRFEGGRAVDHFGRCRYFEDRPHRIRNFLVQSPAALVCLEKLIDLHGAVAGMAKVAFHVHDGYVVAAKTEGWRDVLKTAFAALESPSEFCPGLKLTATCRAGRRLDKLSLLGRTAAG